MSKLLIAEKELLLKDTIKLLSDAYSNIGKLRGEVLISSKNDNLLLLHSAENYCSLSISCIESISFKE